MKAVLVRDTHEWEATVQLLLPHTTLLEQSRLVGHGIGIEMLYLQGERVWYFCHERLHEGSATNGIGGASWYRRSLVPPAELLESCTALLNHLRWNGLAMLEFLRTANGNVWLMEINPRLWGSIALAVDAGVDFPWGLMLCANREKIPPQPKYRIPYFTRSFAEDVLWLGARVRSNPWAGIVELTKLGRPLLGLESWDFFDWGDLRVTFSALLQLARRIGTHLGKNVRARLSRRRMTLIHEKNLARLTQEKQSVRKLLVLCYGNICRSPFVERIMQRQLPHLDVSSAGFHPISGRTSPAVLQLCASSVGVDLSAHRSRRVAAEEVKSADMILLMDSANLADFRGQFPDDLGKVLFLGMFLSPGCEIHDPFDAGIEQTTRILDQSVQAIQNVVRWLTETLGERRS